MKKITITKINNWQEIPWKEIMIIIRDLQNKIMEAMLKNKKINTNTQKHENSL
jgi:hypothetical protein